ncbi:putative ribokinase [Selenomonas ruminantium subsp. lactilytica TAM6421]|uniref:Ribokinase n=1 Tax=Selenomonas ruminantium subsp. lactilytica (strain NBRC 103574 / TAM6421) TaxID=927704 RepID=I0GTY2_SELRL|nr:ribokinase [Selenomonas ruminantium]BAL84219.1 putative ribokinase [Selenomonas ruminantium subsp. lactilytica TAM6421]
MEKVLVVGSLNMDFAVYMDRRPQAGETVMAQGMKLVPGGKGANQAYALGKLGADTSMIGAVGDDTFGQQMLANLEHVSVDTAGIKQIAGVETGKAFIEIEDSGQNSISVIAGANASVDEGLVLAQAERFAKADAVVMQLEIPVPSVIAAAKLAKKHNKTVVLDPAPARADLPDELWAQVDITKPNETELALLTGLPTNTEEEVVTAARSLIAKGVKNVLVTLGGDGTLLVNDSTVQKFPAYKVKAVDTTAAGDCFLAAFMSRFDGENFATAVDFGAKASAIAVTRQGAQTSIPTVEEVEKFN